MAETGRPVSASPANVAERPELRSAIVEILARAIVEDLRDNPKGTAAPPAGRVSATR
jgi:hypothetical protein